MVGVPEEPVVEPPIVAPVLLLGVPLVMPVLLLATWAQAEFEGAEVPPLL
jgi:hypothetical protein